MWQPGFPVAMTSGLTFAISRIFPSRTSIDIA
jgi:hypothetical protein